MEKIKIVLDWFPNTVHTGLLLAQKKGYFQQEGVEVEIFGEPHNIMDFQGADMICGPATSMLVNMMNGIDMTGIATFTQRCDSGIVSLKESGITSPRMLEGQAPDPLDPALVPRPGGGRRCAWTAETTARCSWCP